MHVNAPPKGSTRHRGQGIEPVARRGPGRRGAAVRGPSRRWAEAIALLAALALTACSQPVRSPGLDAATVEPTLDAAAEMPTAADVVATDTAPQPEQATAEPDLPTIVDACADPSFATEAAGWAFIIATAPNAGERVQSGFHAVGCANVFEASVAWRLVDGQDATLAEGHGMASCGTGCVGSFDLVVDYPAPAEPGIGYLEVYTESAEDGHPVHVNRIALILE